MRKKPLQKNLKKRRRKYLLENLLGKKLKKGCKVTT